MIAIYLTGGLGNQMFQYAAAGRLAIKHNTVVCLDLSWYDDPENVDRPFQLTKQTISEPVIMKVRRPRDRAADRRPQIAAQESAFSEPLF
jgi:hypothetical protein